MARPLVRRGTSGCPMIYQAGEYRALAALKPKRSQLVQMPTWPIGVDLPPEQWQASDPRNWNVPVPDQGTSSACVGFQWATAYRYAWRFSGQIDRPFSPWWIYGWINQGRDAGSQIGWGYQALMKYGAALSGKVEDGDLPDGKIWYPADLKKLPAVQQKAKRYRLGAAYRLEKVQQIGTALSLHFLVIGGILVDRKFGNLDGESVCPLPDPKDPYSGGHAVALVGMKRSTKWGWTYLDHNSWSSRWGDGGFGWIHDRHFTDSGWPLDLYAIQAVADDPGEYTDDPPVPA